MSQFARLSRRHDFCDLREHDSTPRYGPGRTLKPLLTVSELASLLGVTRGHVYRLAIPYVMVGDRRRFRPEDVDEYLEARRWLSPRP